MSRVHLISDDVAVLFQLAENEELINNERSGKAAYGILKGQKKLIEYPGIGHFDIYIGDHFIRATDDAVAWYREHL